MKVPALKKLIESYSLDELKRGEEALLNEESLELEVDGEDEGEKLTHILGAIEVMEMIDRGMNPREALREFAKRIRNSIN